MEWLIGILVIIFIALVIYSNLYLTVETFNLPASCSLRIVQLSDLHNGRFGKDNVILIEKIRQLKPDIICITGDLIDKRFPKRQRALELLKKLAEICPIYYVRGNHEVYLKDRQFLEDVKAVGVHYLENETVFTGGIRLIGLDDASMCGDRTFEHQKQFVEEHLDQLADKREEYTVLLSHQPQHIDSYSRYPIDLVLSGHVHGGQVRLPLLGGLYGPQQGILPKYDNGLYEMNRTKMIVSRGLGNSLFPFRFNNLPEIVLICLQQEGDVYD